MLNFFTSAALAAGCAIVGFALLRSPAEPTQSLPAPFRSAPAPIDEAALLEGIIPEVRFVEEPLGEALQKLADAQRVNVCVLWRSLEQTRMDPISLVLHHVTLRQAIESCFKTSSSSNPIRVFAENGIVTVSSAQAVSDRVRIEAVNIRPLLDKLIAKSDGSARSGEESRGLEFELIDALSKIIVSTIDPESWRDTQGPFGEISGLGAVLVIAQTPENLTRIRGEIDLLLAAASADDIAVSTRPSLMTFGSSIPATELEANRFVTKCFNLRTMIENVGAADQLSDARDTNWIYPRPQARNDIDNLLIHTINTTSWLNSGGSDGNLMWIGDILVVTQTRRNMALVCDALDTLHRVAGAKDPMIPIPARHRADHDIADREASTAKTIGDYIDVHRLLSQLGSDRTAPHALYGGDEICTRNAISALKTYITQTVAPESWQEAGGSIGKFDIAGGVLAITQTPENMLAIRSALRNLTEVIERNASSSPTTQPATPGTDKLPASQSP